MEISGHTKPYAVLGHPIGHTLSPTMHNAAFRHLKLDAIYLAFDVVPSRLMNVLKAMSDMGFGGANLTVPLKEVAFKGLKNLDPTAADLKAVNTVKFLENGEPKGYNTDGLGFIYAIEEAFGTKISGLSVWVLGCGGAGRAVAITCAIQKAKRVVVSDIESERAAQVAAEIAQCSSTVEVDVIPTNDAAYRQASRGTDLIVHSTPIGMTPGDPSLLPRRVFNKEQMVYDLIYMYPATPIMKAANHAGASVSNGLSMLLHQGAEAYRIWTGKEAPVDTMRKAMETSVYGVNSGHP